MTAKEYLRSYRRMAEKLKQIEDDIDHMKLERDSIQIRADGMPASSGISDRVATLAAKIVDMENDYLGKREDLLRHRAEIREVILSVPDDRQSEVLDLRYIQGLKWEEIADRMAYYPRHVQRIHGYALLEVQKILDRDQK